MVWMRNLHVQVFVNCYANREKELRDAACSVVALEHPGSYSQRCHYPGGSNFTNRTIKSVRDVNVARFIGGNTKWVVQLRGIAGAIGAPRNSSRPGKGCNHPG